MVLLVALSVLQVVLRAVLQPSLAGLPLSSRRLRMLSTTVVIYLSPLAPQVALLLETLFFALVTVQEIVLEWSTFVLAPPALLRALLFLCKLEILLPLRAAAYPSTVVLALQVVKCLFRVRLVLPARVEPFPSLPVLALMVLLLVVLLLLLLVSPVVSKEEM
jgi:hypothetical protein